MEAADRGVRVRFLIDDIYHSGRDDVYALFDSHPNFEVRIFNPMANRGAGRWLDYAMNRKHLNHRMHNKIFLADNAVAVLGGRNIGNDYFGIDTKANFFDLDVLATGPAAREAGHAFDEYWNSKYAVPIRVLDDKTFTPEDLQEARQADHGSTDPEAPAGANGRARYFSYSRRWRLSSETTRPAMIRCCTLLVIASGSPSVITRLASLPASIVPSRSETPRISAGQRVMARRASSGDRP